MNQPVPNVGSADIERLITRDFRPEDVASVRAALATYGVKEWHREPERVRAAVLKMAAGNVHRLQHALAIADSDYRDILAYAEYPSYMKKISPSEKDTSKRQKAIEDDSAQYQAWFEKNA